MTDHLLRKFAELNPVADPDRLVALEAPELPADPVLRAVLERTRTNGGRPDPMRPSRARRPRPAHTRGTTRGRDEDMQATEVRPDRQPTTHRRTGILAVLGAAAVVILVAIAGSVVLNDRDQGPVGAEEIGNARAETIHRMVQAINDRDAAAFVAAFVDEGSFHARGQFPESSSPFANDQPVADTELVEAWMVFVDAWGHEAQVRHCDRREDVSPGSLDGRMTVTCEVTTRWHTLSMEITEQWEYDFSGDLLRSWRYQPLDLDPEDRALALGFSGLEQWETWLQTNRPDDAARYLGPRDPSCVGCKLQWVEDLTSDDPGRLARVGPLVFSTERTWNINGHAFVPAGLIPYDPAFADEIEGAIHAYLESR